jgi:hypothetical protein
MSARIALPTLILAAAAATVMPGPAKAGPWGLAPGEWYTNIEGSSFSSTTVHLADGTRAGVGLVVEQRALASATEMGWRHGITLLYALPAASITQRFATFQGTSTGFQDVQLGARCNLRNGPTALAVELDWSAPAGYNSHLISIAPALGDGLQELSAGVALGTAVGGRGFMQGSIGYGYRYLTIGKRDKGSIPPDEAHVGRFRWADHVLASADLGYWMGSSLLIGGRYRGMLSMSSGPLVPEIDQHLAGPLLLYRVDERLDMFAGSWSTASGKNTLHFDQVYVGMAFHKTTLNRLQGFLGSNQAP